MASPNPIPLDLRTLLPKVRAAYEAGELQAQTRQERPERCRYAGPCAVGVGLSLEDRRRFDRRTRGSISDLITSGATSAPTGHADDLRPSSAHDNWAMPVAGADGSEAAFLTTLTTLEAKYVQQA